MPLHSEEEPSATLKSVHGKCEDKGKFACQVEACGERFYHAKGSCNIIKVSIISLQVSTHASYTITCMWPIYYTLVAR